MEPAGWLRCNVVKNVPGPFFAGVAREKARLSATSPALALCDILSAELPPLPGYGPGRPQKAGFFAVSFQNS